MRCECLDATNGIRSLRGYYIRSAARIRARNTSLAHSTSYRCEGIRTILLLLRVTSLCSTRSDGAGRVARLPSPLRSSSRMYCKKRGQLFNHCRRLFATSSSRLILIPCVHRIFKAGEPNKKQKYCILF